MRIRQVLPTLITLVAMMLGFLSILLVVEGMRQDGDHGMYRLASIMIMVAMILDGLDGNLARYLKVTSEFGAELDTYVDLTAFGIAPAVLIFAVSSGTDTPWRVVLPSAVCLSGVVRLARFKAKDPLRGQGGYAGLPITVNAGWVALFVFISQTRPLDIFSFKESMVALLFLTGVLVFIILQVTNVRYPKPTKNSVLFGICFFLVLLFMFLSLNERLNARYSIALAVVMISLGAGYIILGPLFVKGMEAHKARHNAANPPAGQDKNAPPSGR